MVTLRRYGGRTGGYMALSFEDGMKLSQGKDGKTNLRLIVGDGEIRIVREEDLFDKSVGQPATLHISGNRARINCLSALRAYQFIDSLDVGSWEFTSQVTPVGDTYGLRIDYKLVNPHDC